MKLRPWDGHVHAVALTDLAGDPYDGPGTDLRGDAAERVFALARPMLEVLEELEPGLEVRSLSMDLPRQRVLLTAAPERGEPRPRVVRVDAGPLYDRLLAAAGPLLEDLTAQMAAVLARRHAATPYSWGCRASRAGYTAPLREGGALHFGGVEWLPIRSRAA